MRHAPARPEQSQSPSPNAIRKLKHEMASLEQQRAALLRALTAAEQSVRTFQTGSLEQGKARARVTRLQNELRCIKGKLGIVKQHQNLGDFLVEIFRERVTRTEWQRIVAEARRRHDSQDALERVGALSASMEPARSRPTEMN